jgi:RND family efflux transporter MFP subunit
MKAGTTIAVVVAIVTAVAVARHQKGEADAAPAPGAAASPTVTLATAQVRDLPVVVDASGSVVPVDTVDVRAQSATIVQAVHIKDGEFVQANQLLFTLDDRADRANLDKARQQVLKDEAALADAKRQLGRSRELAAQNFVSPSVIDTAQSNVDAAVALVAADQAAVHAAEVALGFDTVRAPLAGRAGAVNVYPGSLVSPTGTALVTISRIDPIAVQFTVAESEVPALLQGLSAGSPVRAIPGADAAPGTVGAAAGAGAASAARAVARADAVFGKLVFVDNTIDPGTGTIKAKARFDNADRKLWPGQYVRVHLTLRDLPGAIVIPQAAVIQRGAEHGVYVVDAHGVAQWRSVTLVLPSGAVVAVQGVKAGERVVTDGKQNVRPGAAVREAGASATPGVPASGAAAGVAS